MIAAAAVCPKCGAEGALYDLPARVTIGKHYIAYVVHEGPQGRSTCALLRTERNSIACKACGTRGEHYCPEDVARG